MAAGDIYRKTERGHAEVRDRKLKLSPRLRTMLILVDGVLPELILKDDAARVGAPPDFMKQLVAAGLVERVSGAAAAPAPEPQDDVSRFMAAKQFMNVTVVDALGIKAFFFTLKLERASVLADLKELVGPYRDAIARAEGEKQADVLVARLQRMLG